MFYYTKNINIVTTILDSMTKALQKKPIDAIAKKIIIGRQTELEFVDYLERHPGSTAYEVSKALKWSNGKVQGVIGRMEGELNFEETVKNGRLKKKIFLLEPEDFLEE